MRTSMKELLESGVHFGHQTRRWNPKMAKYIFAERNGIYIIDLQKTLRMLETACDYVQDIAAEGGTVLFVGTKRQSQEAVLEEATRCQMFYVSHRWLGGMLTNFQTIRRSIQRLEKLEADEANGVFDQLPKKEVIRLGRERTKLTNNLTGIKAMKRSPDAVIITDTRKEHTAILESNKLGIPVIGIVDTNCDPQLIDFPIPGNDDAIRAIRLICSVLATSIIEGRGSASEGADISEAVAESDESETAESSDELEVKATDGEGETLAGTAKAEATAKRPQRRRRTSTKSQKADREIEPKEAETPVAQSDTVDTATESNTEDEAEAKPKPARRKRRASAKTKKADAETETPEVETAAAGSISEDSATRDKVEPVEAEAAPKPARRKRRTSAKTKKAEAETETPEVTTRATEPISKDAAAEEKSESTEADSAAKPARRKRRTSAKTKKADAETAEATASDTSSSSTASASEEATEAEA